MSHELIHFLLTDNLTYVRQMSFQGGQESCFVLDIVLENSSSTRTLAKLMKSLCTADHTISLIREISSCAIQIILKFKNKERCYKKKANLNININTVH